jgi:hypothetical protein
MWKGLVLGVGVGVCLMGLTGGSAGQETTTGQVVSPVPGPPKPPAAKIVVVEGKLDRDFGEMEPDKTIKYTITVENQGTSATSLTADQKGCGRCPPLKFVNKPLAPGKRAHIDVTYNTGLKKDKVVRRVFVKTDDPDHKVLEVVTRWQVEPALDVRPAALDFGKSRWKESLLREIEVVIEGVSEDVQIVKAEPASPFLKVGAVEKREEPLRWVLPVDFQPPAQAGEWFSTVTLTTTSKKMPVIRVPAEGNILGPLQCDPSYLNFNTVKAGETPSLTARIVAADTFRVTDAEVDPKVATCELQNAPDGSQIVKVTLSPELARGAVHKTEVTLKTDCPGQPELKLAVLARVE